jgi:hypothetical protein
MTQDDRERKRCVQAQLVQDMRRIQVQLVQDIRAIIRTLGAAMAQVVAAREQEEPRTREEELRRGAGKTPSDDPAMPPISQAARYDDPVTPVVVEATPSHDTSSYDTSSYDNTSYDSGGY